MTYQQRAAAALARYDNLTPTLEPGRIPSYMIQQNGSGQSAALLKNGRIGWSMDRNADTSILTTDLSFAQWIAATIGNCAVKLSGLRGLPDDARVREYDATIRARVESAIGGAR